MNDALAAPISETETYKANYAILKATADELRKAGSDIDIDDLIPKVERAMKASVFCKARIDQAQKAMASLFAEAEAGGSHTK